MTAPTPATPLCMAPACSRPAMHDGECGPAPMSGWEFQPDSRDTASTLLPPTPDTPVEVGAGAFIESVPTPGTPTTTVSMGDARRIAVEIADQAEAERAAAVTAEADVPATTAVSSSLRAIAEAERIVHDLGIPNGRLRVVAGHVERIMAVAERRGAGKALRAAAACLDNDDDGPDTTTKGDPR